MKPLPVLLASSLAANAALLVALAFKPALAPPAFRDFFHGCRVAYRERHESGGIIQSRLAHLLV